MAALLSSHPLALHAPARALRVPHSEALQGRLEASWLRSAAPLASHLSRLATPPPLTQMQRKPFKSFQNLSNPLKLTLKNLKVCF